MQSSRIVAAESTATTDDVVNGDAASGGFGAELRARNRPSAAGQAILIGRVRETAMQIERTSCEHVLQAVSA